MNNEKARKDMAALCESAVAAATAIAAAFKKFAAQSAKIGESLKLLNEQSAA
jgi:hypothetical protein